MIHTNLKIDSSSLTRTCHCGAYLNPPLSHNIVVIYTLREWLMSTNLSAIDCDGLLDKWFGEIIKIRSMDMSLGSACLCLGTLDDNSCLCWSGGGCLFLNMLVNSRRQLWRSWNGVLRSQWHGTSSCRARGVLEIGMGIRVLIYHPLVILDFGRAWYKLIIHHFEIYVNAKEKKNCFRICALCFIMGWI